MNALPSILSLVFAAGPPARAEDPRYHRGMFLFDSLAAADLIVHGTPHKPGSDPKKEPAALHVAEVLFGKATKDLQLPHGSLKLVAPYRLSWERRGLWLLLRTPQGYFAMNPDNEPLDRAEWTVLAKILRGRPQAPADLQEKLTDLQLYRWFRDPKRQKDIRHGADVWLGQGGVSFTLYQHGKPTLGRGWDHYGRLDSVYRADLSLRLIEGRTWEVCQYKNGQKDGLYRRYFQSKLDQLYEESHWRGGLRHGTARTWTEHGKLESEIIYEDGFLPPVIRYRGKKPGKAKLHQTETTNYYRADANIVDALKIGLTTDEVSRILKLDFSTTEGIRFSTWTPRDHETYVQIDFVKGRVASRREGIWKQSFPYRVPRRDLQ